MFDPWMMRAPQRDFDPKHAEGTVLASVRSAAIQGIDAYVVEVEVDAAPGLPSFSTVGLAQSAVKEGKDRVLSAIANSGYEVAPRKITINLAPADLRKEGSHFDLPIAYGLLIATGQLAGESPSYALAGELGLDGSLRPIRGALSIALALRREDVRGLVLPAPNASEAAVLEDFDVRGATSLTDVVEFLAGRRDLPKGAPGAPTGSAKSERVDLADIRGQVLAKRALEVAAAGAHNILLIGPPGGGKTMLARRLATILPDLAPREALEVTQIHSVAGQLPPGCGLVTSRPFRRPHHSVSDAGLIGGGSVPRPGEVSMAHHGVLFLDELPEFRRNVLEVLRQPLEDGYVTLVRARQSLTYPARFVLVAAMNPCPCGHLGDAARPCRCTGAMIRRYRARISGPLLDRIDLQVEVPAVSAPELLTPDMGESSATVRARVQRARHRQIERFESCSGLYANAHMGPRDVTAFCRTDDSALSVLRSAMTRFGMSARAYHRTLKIARTIADLQEEDTLRTAHIAEAIQYRGLDRALGASIHSH